MTFKKIEELYDDMYANLLEERPENTSYPKVKLDNIYTIFNM